MATPSSIGWKIPWTEEPGRLHTVHGIAKSQTQLSDCARTHMNIHIKYTHTHMNWIKICKTVFTLIA